MKRYRLTYSDGSHCWMDGKSAETVKWQATLLLWNVTGQLVWPVSVDEERRMAA